MEVLQRMRDRPSDSAVLIATSSALHSATIRTPSTSPSRVLPGVSTCPVAAGERAVDSRRVDSVVPYPLVHLGLSGHGREEQNGGQVCISCAQIAAFGQPHQRIWWEMKYGFAPAHPSERLSFAPEQSRRHLEFEAERGGYVSVRVGIQGSERSVCRNLFDLDPTRPVQ